MNLRSYLPPLGNVGLALLAAGLLILAFPDFELWFLAWFALVPLLWAIERQSHCVYACALLGWIFGTAFFFGTCWWLTYAPIHYASVPWPLAYFLIFIVCVVAGLFPAIFTTILSVLLRRFGSKAFLAAPFVWVFTEFLRYWLIGNNWNAVGYSQAFSGRGLESSSIGGVLLVSFCVSVPSAVVAVLFLGEGALIRNSDFRTALKGIAINNSFSVFYTLTAEGRAESKRFFGATYDHAVTFFFIVLMILFAGGFFFLLYVVAGPNINATNGAFSQSLPNVVALQPNVPMSGVTTAHLEHLRQKQVVAAELELSRLSTDNRQPTTVILPESPMNFMYNDDREFQEFIGDFARRNNVSVLFNSAEPDKLTGKYFNSAVMVGPDGREAVQYDKIYLLPFGEAVPPILEGIVPGFVGNFSYGGEYDLFPLGDAKAGVMICFESHFGQLSREYVRNGADVLIEMTNDGYLGPTPVLRQHLANAVFRAVETNRPVLRVTNVGITAYISERGQVLDEVPSYTEATRVWSVAKSDGSQTFYVRYGDWFAWLCSIITVTLLLLCFRKRPKQQEA